MKAFEQSNGEVSRDHHYVLARNITSGEQAHFAFPKTVIPAMVDAINIVRALLPDDWRQFDLDDRYYGNPPAELIDRWSRNFRTDIAVSALEESTS